MKKITTTNIKTVHSFSEKVQSLSVGNRPQLFLLMLVPHFIWFLGMTALLVDIIL